MCLRGRIKYATSVCLATKLLRKCKRFSKLCLSVPRFPCGISCSTRPFYKLAFFKRDIFLGCFFNKREEQTSNVSWSISGVFHTWGGNPSSQNPQSGKSPGIPTAPPQSCHLNLVPRHHRIKIFLLSSCRTGWAWLPHLRELPDGPS